MKRIESIDFAKGIAIIAVTFGHILGSYHIYSVLFTWVYSFELPLFFIVSGYLSAIKMSDLPIRDYILKQAKAVLIPYLEFSIVYILIDIVIGFLTRKEIVHQLFINIGYIFSGIGLGALWFMPTFFMASVIAYFVSQSIIFRVGGKLRKILVCVAVCGVGSVAAAISEKYGYIHKIDFSKNTLIVIGWNVHVLFTRSILGASLVLLGNILGTFRDKYTNLGENKIKALFLGTVFIASGAIFGLKQDIFVDLHFGFIRNPIMFYIGAMASTIGFMCIGSAVQLRWISWLGKNSLYIMFCQIVQEYWCRVVNKFVDIDKYNTILQYGVCFGSLIAVLMIAFLITFVMLKYDMINIYKRRKKYV